MKFMLNKWKSLHLWKKNLIALVLGISVGLVFKDYVGFMYPIGNAFMNLLKMMAIPLVFVSLINTIISITNTEKIAYLAIKAGILFIITTLIAIVIAITMSIIVQPGAGVNIALNSSATQSPVVSLPILDIVLNIIPSNPFKSFTEGNVLQIVFLSLFIGIVLAKLKVDKTVVTNIVNVANDVVFSMVNFIIQLMPFGIFALLSYSVSVIGYDLVAKLAVFVILVCTLCLFHIFVVYPLLLKLTGNKITEFYKYAFQAMLTSFSLSSSSSTLPVSMECAKKLNIDPTTRSFIIPLGSTVNMNGSAIQQVVITIFVAQMIGMDLYFYHYFVILLTTLVTTIGTAGVPSAGLVMTSVVLNALGLPIEGIAIVAGVDRVIDMLTSSVNVTGDLVIAKIVSAKESKSIDLQ